jgi:hypothetical protein
MEVIGKGQLKQTIIRTQGFINHWIDRQGKKESGIFWNFTKDNFNYYRKENKIIKKDAKNNSNSGNFSLRLPRKNPQGELNLKSTTIKSDNTTKISKGITKDLTNIIDFLTNLC